MGGTNKEQATEALFAVLAERKKGALGKVLSALSQGADVHATYPRERHEYTGMTPLMLAVDRGLEVPVLQALLSVGADAKKKYSNGDTLLMRAVSKYDAYYLRYHGKQEWDAVVNCLVTAGVDVNAVNNHASALLIAVKNGDFEQVQALLDNGANVCNEGHGPNIASAAPANQYRIKSLLRAALERAVQAKTAQREAELTESALRKTLFGEKDADLETMNQRNAIAEKLMLKNFPNGFAKAVRDAEEIVNMPTLMV